MEAILSIDFMNSILRATTPIIFVTMASVVASKSGICNMALEGMMLFGALFGVIFSSITGAWWSGLALTMTVGGCIGLVLAFFILNMKTDEILAAIAINLIATGGTVLILLAFSGDRGVSSSIASVPAPRMDVPLLANLPIIGGIFKQQNILTYIAIITVLLIHILLYKTPLGLNIRAVGENKDAAESVGININKIKYIALFLSGILASVGGFFLSGGFMNMFTRDMSAGRGFIALAASAMGGNTPVGGFLVSALFGMADSLANVMQIKGNIPYELIQMLPYITTLVGFSAYSFARNSKRKRLTR